MNQITQKRLIRERQVKTGEAYNVARVLVLAKDRKQKTLLRNVKKKSE